MGLDYAKTIEKWDVLEVTVNGPKEGNPFCDQWIKGTFGCKNEKKTVDGFYDGDGVYKVRFMPSFTDEYTFEIEASFDINAGEEVPDEETLEHKFGIADGGKEAEKCAVRNMLTGSFTVTSPSADNHGPVRVAGTYYLSYEDGTPYHCIGTTCYVWNLQNEELQKQTLKTLEENAFNKIRFCIFPKHYDYNLHEPITYPYEGTPCDSSVLNENNFAEYNGCAPGNDWDFTRFNPAHFQHIEKCIQALMNLGIEADLIVMHPYDRWGFSMMKAEDDDRYWKYVLARFSAYRNVWWSLANEYDLMYEKTLSDWERYAGIICEKDPYHHLRSIHNCKAYYDYNLPWITHCSIQRTETYRSSELVNEWREKYHKPVILDEICYEGNIQFGWGNISGEEMTRRFWRHSAAEDIRDTVKHISVRIVFSGGLMAAFFTEPHRSVSDFLQKSWRKHRDLVWNLCPANGMRLLAVLPVSRQGKIILFTIIPLCGRASGISTLMILQSIGWKLSIPGK